MKFSLYSQIELLLIAMLCLVVASCAAVTGTTDRDWQQLMVRNTQLRTVSSQAASQGQLSKADFQQVIKVNDQVRAQLDQAKGASTLSRTMHIANARTQLGELENFMKSKGVKVPLAVESPPGTKPSTQPAKKEK